MQYDEPTVRREDHRLYVRDYPGSEPAIILMHGFPDNLHLYDRVVPLLDNGRRVVTFDFLGWGRSDKPAGYAYTASNQTGDLDAVIGHLQLGSVVLVAHDASGPPVPAERAGPPGQGRPSLESGLEEAACGRFARAISPIMAGEDGRGSC